MTETKTSICNRALDLIGEANINSYENDTSAVARICRNHFDIVFNMLLESGQWSKTITEEKLTRIDIPERYKEEYKFAYSIPAKCVFIIKVYVPELRSFKKDGNNWDLRYIPEINSNVIISDSDKLNIEYVRNVEDVTMFPAKFLNALSAGLAHKICMPITKDLNKTNIMLQYYQMAYKEALLFSLNETGQDKEFGNSPITNSRGMF